MCVCGGMAIIMMSRSGGRLILSSINPWFLQQKCSFTTETVFKNYKYKKNYWLLSCTLNKKLTISEWILIRYDYPLIIKITLKNK